MISGSFQLPYNQFSEHDEETLTGLASKVLEGDMCEIGCWTGHSTAILARRAKEIGGRVIVVDNFIGNKGTPLEEYAKYNSIKDIFTENMKSLGLWNNIVLFNMDSSEAYKFIKPLSLSFLFIDASHEYKNVKEDLINYILLVKKTGIICGHDYESNTYDENHTEEDYVNGKHHGVIKAVNEIMGDVIHEGRMWWK